jgi:Putative metallopeptidase
MPRANKVTGFSAAAMWLSLLITPLHAQLQPNQINVVYEEPKNAKYRPILARLRDRKVLETLQQFLSPLKLPRQLTVKTAECGDIYAAYNSGGPVVICYEFVDLIEKLQPPEQYYGSIGASLVTREMATVGPFVQEVMHDVALGVFDVLEVPVWGRASDAADNVAGFLMLQFGTDVARKTILGTAFFLNQLDLVIRNSTNWLTDVNYLGAIRPTVRQRYYNILCIAIGSDPVGFSLFLPINREQAVTDVPLYRSCTDSNEYEQVKDAFVRTILNPYVDPDLLKQVRAMQWLKDN